MFYLFIIPLGTANRRTASSPLLAGPEPGEKQKEN